jgi:hypothetical protein
MRAVAPESAALFAEKYRSHPALFSYYLCDEPSHSSPSAASEAPVLARATEILHRLDPNHPTHALVIPWCASNVYRYRDVVDVLSADHYVVRGAKDNPVLWEVWRASEALRRSATDGQVSIFTPLAGGNITREENWAQAYMCLAAGAGGIMWFEFGGAQGRWADFIELGKELRSIEEFLVGVELEKGLAFAGDAVDLQSDKTLYPGFRQIRGIGRASAKETALITVNVTPLDAKDVRITAPFLAHARRARVLFESREVAVAPDGVITDSFRGLERHVYVVGGVPDGVKPRPEPKPGGPHVTGAGAAWRSAAGGMRERSAVELERERLIAAEVGKAEDALARGDRDAARRILEGILRRFPDAQEIRERLRSL